MRRQQGRLILAGLALLAASCTVDDLAEPQGPGAQPRIEGRVTHVDPPGAIPTFPEPLDYIRSIPVTEGLPPELSDEELVAAIAVTRGSAFIALKAPGDRRTREMGYTPAITKTTYQEGRAELERLGVQVVRTYRSLPFFQATIDPQMAPVLRKLDIVDEIGAAGSSELSSAGAGAAAVMFSEAQDWGLQKVGAHHVWAAEGNYGDSAIVTVIDSGIDSVHYDVWSYDGPGHASSACSYIYIAGLVERCYQPWDLVHGSRVAGVASARMNSFGYVGISPKPKHFRSIRICYFDYGISKSNCPVGSQIAALNWLENNGGSREIINMSFGDPVNDWWRHQAVIGASNAGHLLVAGAGNNTANTITYPARHAQVIAVTGTTPSDSFAFSGKCPYGSTYSTYGNEAELAAPFWATNMVDNGSHGSSCGTSLSAPVVAGVAALVWTKHPTLTAAQVRSRLTSNAIDRGAAGHDAYYGYGRVDAPQAVYGKLATWIVGPSTPTGGLDTWTAMSTNGFNNSYAWERLDCSNVWQPVGSNSNVYQEMASPTDQFRLRVTVTSVGRTATDMMLIGGFPIC